MTPPATPPTQTYMYDEENRLTGAAGYTYTYDADGKRVRKSNGNLAANGTLYRAETDLAGAKARPLEPDKPLETQSMSITPRCSIS
ncbi:MAG: hypothetical protein LAO78_15290 [Acidobacteriia bacterium]|nr:hypothetical protein [Terriglobia bacterium]